MRDTIETMQCNKSAPGMSEGSCSPTHRPQPTHRTQRTFRGQVAPIMAIAMLAIIIVVGLAVDGGATFAKRREAQNSADAAAMAATQDMLNRYETMITNSPVDVDGTNLDDSAINTKLITYAAAHGISRANLEAYYITDDKQLVSASQVGSVGSVPWTSGAKGVLVKNSAQTDSYFMKILNWNTVGASAVSSAFMGVATDTGQGLKLLPIGFFTDTEHLANLQIPNVYTLINGDVSQASGNWGWINWNGLAESTPPMLAWLACGFDPAQTQAEWEAEDCGGYGRTPGYGPAQYYECANAACTQPVDTASSTNALRWGPGPEGMWIGGSSGQTNSVCQRLSQVLNLGDIYNFPVFDMSGTAGGNNAAYHMLAIAKFEIAEADIQCHPTPDPISGQNMQHWYIRGSYQGLFLAGAQGKHGNLRRVSGHVVFPDN